MSSQPRGRISRTMRQSRSPCRGAIKTASICDGRSTSRQRRIISSCVNGTCMVLLATVVAIATAPTILPAQTVPSARPASIHPNELAPWNVAFSADAPGLVVADRLLDAPAGKDGFVTQRDAHFCAGSTDRRLRFFGVNICFGGCFPSHAQADAVAARLARFGVNAVRFHHLDNAPFPRGIFADEKLEALSPEA